jgi:uncharacterized membrane protein YbhN (UPF0104 family)
MKSHLLPRIVGPVTSLALLAGAVFLLTRSLKDLRLAEVGAALHALPIHSIVLAIGLTFASQLALSIYDYIGIRYIKSPLSYPRTALTSFMAYSISHSLGFAAVTGGTVRYRMYSRWGLGAIEVAQVMGMAGITLFLGMFEIGGVALLLDGARVKEWSDLPQTATNALGVLFLTLVVTYVTIGFFVPRNLKIGSFKLTVPSPLFAITQILVSSADWLLVASVLYVLLPDNVSFMVFLGSFVLAYMLGTLSNVPGGLGVFESIIVVSLHHTISPEAIVGSLLAYRCVYHLMPLAIGGTLFLCFEFAGRPGKQIPTREIELPTPTATTQKCAEPRRISSKG